MMVWEFDYNALTFKQTNTYLIYRLQKIVPSIQLDEKKLNLYRWMKIQLNLHNWMKKQLKLYSWMKKRVEATQLDEINGCCEEAKGMLRKKDGQGHGQTRGEKKEEKEASNTFIFPCNNNYGAHISKASVSIVSHDVVWTLNQT